MSNLVWCETCQGNHSVQMGPCPTPRKAGHTSSGDYAGHVFAVFSRDAAVEARIAEYPDPCDLATALTGWSSFSRGPGRAFGAEPIARVYKRNVYVRQFRGLDV